MKIISNPDKSGLAKNPFNQGQTLIEAIVALGLVSIIIVALTAVTTVSLSRANFVRERVQAEKYAQEGSEWIRAERDSSWGTFSIRVDPGENRTYCLNTLGWTASGVCAYSLGGLFKREAFLTRAANLDPPPPVPCDNTQHCIQVRVLVTWQSGGKTHTSDQTTYLTKYER